ncbi:hypothetical protein [Thiohalorhabdus methylotrophus]|uniref:Uncharacterized protein n=1 Tax=Thiohalorhabdus methylotrophus TaxID=3242694 RepID=A0ABV4TZ23_9GAMM
MATMNVTFREPRFDGSGGWRLEFLAGKGAPEGVVPWDPEGGTPPEAFVHCVLDQWVPGFPVRGYIPRAKALMQKASRTGADPLPDFQALADDLLANGEVEGEPLWQILPRDLIAHLPTRKVSGRAPLNYLRSKLGHGAVRSMLVVHFIDLGRDALAPGRATWYARGMDYERRGAIGEAMRELFTWMEGTVHEQGWRVAQGELALANDVVRFRFDCPVVREWARAVEPARTPEVV